MFELFHRIGDASSARVRKYVTENELFDIVRFRNLTYPEVEADFVRLGGTEAPALWTGQVLISGAEKIVAALSAHKDVGREF